MAERLRNTVIALGLVLALGGCATRGDGGSIVQRTRATAVGHMKDRGMAIAGVIHKLPLDDTLSAAVAESRRMANQIPDKRVAALTGAYINNELVVIVDTSGRPMEANNSAEWLATRERRLREVIGMITDPQAAKLAADDLAIAHANGAAGSAGVDPQPGSVGFLLDTIRDRPDLVALAAGTNSNNIEAANNAHAKLYQLTEASDDQVYGAVSQAYDALYAGSAQQSADVNNQLDRFESAVQRDG